jgi:hypothetical protein
MIYARGAGGAPAFTRIPDESFAAGDQTLYILGHGSAETGKVPDLDAGEIVSTDLREYMKNAAAAVDAFKIRSPTNRADAIGKLFPPGAATTGKAGKARFNV